VASSGTVNSLDLEPEMTSYDWEDGNRDRHVEAHYLDFVIDGRALGAMISEAGSGEYVTPLCRLWLGQVPEEIDRLQGRTPTPDLDSGRVALLVCRVCDDLGCGALTARLEIEVNRVVWSQWLWESNLEPASVPQLTESAIFDRIAYERAFSSAPERLSSMPYDELAHRGRRFLWASVGLALTAQGLTSRLRPVDTNGSCSAATKRPDRRRGPRGAHSAACQRFRSPVVGPLPGRRGRTKAGGSQWC